MPSLSNSPEWWTVQELAKHWRFSVETIRRRMKAGSIRSMHGRIHVSEIERHEAIGKAEPPAARRTLPPIPDELGLHDPGFAKSMNRSARRA